MIEDFRRLAAGPLAAAAAIAAIIGAIVSSFTSLGDPLKSMLISGAGAVGGLIGSSLLQARSRAEERRRALSVLRVQLEDYLMTLESDLQMIASPISDKDGYLTTNANLFHYTSRARRVCTQVATAAVPAPIFSDEINARLTRIRGVAEDLAFMLEDAVDAARCSPKTTEEFHIGLGTNVRRLTEAADGPVVTMLREFVKGS